MSSLIMHLILTILVAFNSCLNSTQRTHACAIHYKLRKLSVERGPCLRSINDSNREINKDYMKRDK